MNLLLKPSKILNNQTIVISGSKSESNRLLLLQKLFPELTIENLSDSDDVTAMLQGINTNDVSIDVHHAGTTMRFLTAYYALCQEKTIQIFGSDRMHNRPIKVLVDALRELGASIQYLEKEGYPPLKINGIRSKGGLVTIPANISSQYISALLLVGTQLENGIVIDLKGEITSRPYIQMTLELIKQLGGFFSFVENKIEVKPLHHLQQCHFVVESDWSSASYFYSLIALSPINTSIILGQYKAESLQGDRELTDIYTRLGVETIFLPNNLIQITKTRKEEAIFLADFTNTPDLAQTLVVSCYGLGMMCKITGLHTLKIKETDRLVALQNELQKFGAIVSISDDFILLEANKKAIVNNVKVETYQDHRMAMAFAPLALKANLIILEANVVTKSFVSFWKDLKTLGIEAVMYE